MSILQEGSIMHGRISERLCRNYRTAVLLCGSAGSVARRAVAWIRRSAGVVEPREPDGRILCYVITTAKKRNDHEWDLEFALWSV